MVQSFYDCFSIEEDRGISHRHCPPHPNVNEGHFDGELGGVEQRFTDSTVPINGNETQMKYGGQAKDCVQKCVQPTEVISKIPAALYRPNGAEGEHGQPQEEVSKGKGENQDVGGSVQDFEMENDDDNKEVPQHRDQRAQGTGHINGQLDSKGV